MGRNELVWKVLGWDSCTEDISFTSKTTGVWRDVEKCKERERAAARDVLPWHVGVRQQRGACLAALRPGSPHLGPGLLLSLLIISLGLEILVIACKLPNGGSCGAVRRLVLRPVCLPSSGNLVGPWTCWLKGHLPGCCAVSHQLWLLCLPVGGILKVLGMKLPADGWGAHACPQGCWMRSPFYEVSVTNEAHN